MHKGFEQVVAVLAILQSGAAYLPIDADLPQHRIDYLLDNGEVNIVLTQNHLMQSLNWKKDLEVIQVQAHLSSEPDYSQLQILDTLQKPEDLAYVIYTSGSTGLPKGVMIEHRAAVNTILDVNERYNIGPQDRVLALSSLSFDLSVYDIFGLLAAGGALVIPEADTQKDPGRWAQLITQHKVSVWNSVPALMDLMNDTLKETGSVLSETLRVVMLSGDWIPVRLAKEISQHRQDIKLVSMGGATECAIWSVLEEIKHVDEASVSIPYGLPMQNQRMRISSLTGEEKPDWVIGEIRIAGEGLARGYWRDEQKSRERFVQQAGEREYRTGDLGRRMPDGRIEIIGREDNQVKVQGYRIELGEIEAALKQEAGVKAAVVTAIGEREGSKRLIGYVVMDGEEGAEREIKEKVRKKVPEYMVPSVIVRMERMPLTANGKIDRNALPVPEFDQTSPEGVQAATLETGFLTKRFSQLVANVLNLKSVEPDANLIELGATSVHIIRIANQFEKEFGFRPDMEKFFALRTVNAIANHFQQLYPEKFATVEMVKPADEQKPKVLRGDVEMLIDPEEREAFKKKQLNIRKELPDGQPIHLLKPEEDDELRRLYVERSSIRQFLLKPVPFERFSLFLSSLRQISLDNHPKYRYASAGGLYPVQAYLYVKPGRIEGIEGGTYYYHAIEHQLTLLSFDATIDRTTFAWINRPIFDQCAFSIFLIAQYDAIQPMYGEMARDFSIYEAGSMGQLLMMDAHKYEIGLCGIGRIEFDRIRGLFTVGENQELLHTLLGGVIDPNQPPQTNLSSFGDPGNEERVMQMLKKLEQLSKEEVRALLAEKRKQRRTEK